MFRAFCGVATHPDLVDTLSEAGDLDLLLNGAVKFSGVSG